MMIDDNDLFDFEAVRPIVDQFLISELAIQIIDDQLDHVIPNKHCCAQIRMPNYVLTVYSVLGIELIVIPLELQS